MIMSAVNVEYQRSQRMQSSTWYVGDLSAQTSNNLEGQAFELVLNLLILQPTLRRDFTDSLLVGTKFLLLESSCRQWVALVPSILTSTGICSAEI